MIDLTLLTEEQKLHYKEAALRKGQGQKGCRKGKEAEERPD